MWRDALGEGRRRQITSEDAVTGKTDASKEDEGRGKQGAEKCGTQAVWPGTTWLMKQQLLSTQPYSAYVRAPVYVYVPVPNVGVYVSDLKDSMEQSDDSHFSCLHGWG